MVNVTKPINRLQFLGKEICRQYLLNFCKSKVSSPPCGEKDLSFLGHLSKVSQSND